MDFKNNIFTFINELNQFDYEISYKDRIWRLIFPDKKNKWHYFHITKYNETYFINHFNRDLLPLEVIPHKSIKTSETFGHASWNYPEEKSMYLWQQYIIEARKWFKIIFKDWIKANKIVNEQFPLKYRTGIAPHAVIRASLQDFYRIDKELGKSKTDKFIKLVEDDYFNNKEKIIRKTMNANDYFNYCKIAYIASEEKKTQVDKNLSGREMYQRYADGRHEGLLDIDTNSENEFAKWLDGTHSKRGHGGHPWEIKRGGNTTHIDLFVIRPIYFNKGGFQVTLRGESFTRLKETICMFLAIYEAGLPITIHDPEGIRKRLLAQDNIGIIPSYDSLHRANQHFSEKESVYDVMHFNDLGRYKNRIKPFITWKPLPIFKPKNIF